jgi:tRNA(Ile)-lysidine synthase
MDEKVPRLKRARIPLLVDRESVIWIPGLRLSERVRVTNRTGRVLKIEIH